MISTADFSVARASWQQDRDVLSQIRFAVFVREQGVPPEFELDEFDADDAVVTHAIVRDTGGQPIATGRVLFNSPIPRIGRMAVLRSWRGRGVGVAMLQFLCDVVREKGYHSVMVHAQTHATPFYYKQGFLSYGTEFTEAGIPHLAMKRSL